MKKTIALLLALVLVVTMAACGGKKQYLSGTVADPGVIGIGVPGNMAETDPTRYDGSLSARALLGMLYEGLTAVDENGMAVGAVAESWEVSATEDAAKRPVYTFTLRQDVCWSDGTPVKAEDFITAWTRVISGAAESPYRYLFDVILGAGDYENEESKLGLAATEDGKLQVTLEGDYAGFPHMLAAPAFWPVREDGSAYNGRYAVSGSDESTLTLTPNTHYHGAKTPAALTLKYYYGDMAALEALAADGTLQATFGYAGEDITPVTGSNGVTICYVLNTERLPDAAQRQQVIKLLVGAEAEVSLGRAVTLLTTADAPADAYAELAKAADLTVNVLGYEEYKAARAAGEYDVLYLAVSTDYPDAAVLPGWFVSGSAGNYAKYNNEEFDEMLSKINAETDEAARADLIKGAEKVLEDDGVLLRVGSGQTALYCHAALTGITCDAAGLWDFGGAAYTAG